MVPSKPTISIVGGGLAGTECALQLANMGFPVVLYEQRRGAASTPAHKTKGLAELVCSNSFGTQQSVSAPGMLKAEARALGSFILKAADIASVPAGNALGVDREVFSHWLTKEVESHPLIQIRDEQVRSLAQIPRPTVIATGPLTSEALAESIQEHFEGEFLYFFDAIAPVIDADSIDMKIAWRANRYDDGDGDYINCPMTRTQYFEFIEAVRLARKVEPKEFEKNTPFFEGCMPIEEMVERGPKTLSFGPMKPVGLPDPRTGREPYAVVQLRQDNKAGTAFNMVGFQTKMAYGEQIRIFRTIPGLENAEFLKLGSIHRNMFINSPKLLNSDLSSRRDRHLFFAGQITGVEGYFESTCVGLLVAKILQQRWEDRPFTPPPRESALGSLLHAITLEEKVNFQPTNINFGLFPPIEEVQESLESSQDTTPAPVKKQRKIPKDQKREMLVSRAKTEFDIWFDRIKN